MCLAQGPQRSDAGEARTHGPSVLSQALYHWATALPNCDVQFLSVKIYFVWARSDLHQLIIQGKPNVFINMRGRWLDHATVNKIEY